jgi:hypothetical protein
MAVVRYPSEFQANAGTDYVTFTRKRRNYNGKDTNSIYLNESDANGIETVVLFMPQKIAEGYSQNYRNSTLGPEGSAALTGGFVGGSKTNKIDFADIAIRLAENKALDYATTGLSMLGTSSLDANAILSATSGVIYNPMMEVLYDGPSFRRFNYQFMLFAKSKSDAEKIYQIVRFFQSASVPSVKGKVQSGGLTSAINASAQAQAIAGIIGTLTQGTKDELERALKQNLNPNNGAGQQGGGAGGILSGLLGNTLNLLTGVGLGGAAISGAIFSGDDRFIRQPPQMKIEYRRGGSEHPYIKSPKICTIENAQIDYTPSGNYTSVNDFDAESKATTVATLITLTFTEMEIVFEDYYS